MQYSTNYEMNKPERADQFNLDYWNQNTDIIDNQLKSNADNIEANSNNILSESNRATGAESALRNLSDTAFKTALLDFCHPIGSYYWSDDSTNPAMLFGGTWVRVKDRFILAKGDTYTGNAGSTGGNATATLSISNLPSHNHYYTPSGTVESHSHENLHNHYINFTTGKGLNNDGYFDRGNPSDTGSTEVDGTIFVKDISVTHRAENEGNDYNYNPRVYAYLSHSHSVTGYTNYGNQETGVTQPAFSGTRDTTENSGSNTAFSVLNPYVLAYCWKRTA